MAKSKYTKILNAKNDAIYRLKSENKKLRELVRQVETCAVYKGMCPMCPLIKFEYGSPSICTSRIGELKRELGINVPYE